MPFNVLLLPLLAGFYFLARSNLRAYATSQLTKDVLLLYAALAGTLLLGASRFVCVALLSTDIGLDVAKQLHRVAPFDYIGTSIATLFLAMGLVWISNLLVPETLAGYWLYHRGHFNTLDKLLWRSAVGVAPSSAPPPMPFTLKLAWRLLTKVIKVTDWKSAASRPYLILAAIRAIRNEHYLNLSGLERGISTAVMLCMKDGRVIVGLVTDVLTSRPNVEHFTVLPIWTGYRDPESNKVLKTTEYGYALKNSDDPAMLARVVRTAEISYATLFSESAFPMLGPATTQPDEAGVVNRPNGEPKTPQKANSKPKQMPSPRPQSKQKAQGHGATK